MDGIIPAQLIERMGPRYHPERVALSRYRIYAGPPQRAVVDRLRDVLAGVAEFVKAGRGLVFYGEVGTGKDHLLCHAMYAAAAQGVKCYPENIERLLAWSENGRIERHVVNRLVEPELFVLSEVIPAIGWPTLWSVRDLYAVIDRRYALQRSTWVSLNAESDEHAEQVLTPPVWSRLCHNTEVFACFWADYRALAAQQEFSR